MLLGRKVMVISVLLAITINTIGCKSSTEHCVSLFNLTSSKFNVLKLAKSGYSYNGDEIFLIEYPYPQLHNSFLSSNYLVLSNQRLSTLSIYDNCDIAFVKQKYKIREKPVSVKDYKECDIYIKPFIDFSMKLSDTLKYYNEWVRLDQKIFDRKMNDTLFKFRRYDGLSPMDNHQTVIFASKNSGIVGVYDTSTVYKDEKIKVNSIGITYKPVIYSMSRFATKKPSVRLNEIKEFKHLN